MDILSIIKENLPDGVEVSEKSLKSIEKEIKIQQALEFVPKDQYNKKVSALDEIKSERDELLGKTAEVEKYQKDISSLQEEYKSYKETSEKKYNDYKEEIETEKTTTAKQTALRKQLQADGANPKFVDLLAKEFEISTIELDGEKIKDWDNLAKPVKEQYADIFGKIEEKGTPQVTPPANNGGVNPFAKSTFNLEMQTKLFREDQNLARQLAASAGIKLPT